MIVGNLLAIVQNNIKRLLAYSSIAHVGYLLMAFVPYGNGEVVGECRGSDPVLSDRLWADQFCGLGCGRSPWSRKRVAACLLEDYAGLGRKYPWLGVAMMAAMFSFTGIPLTLGFWGKFYVFQAAVQGGDIGLALIGLLTSLFSAYYYLRVLVVMYMRPGEPTVRQDSWLILVTVASAAAVVCWLYSRARCSTWPLRLCSTHHSVQSMLFVVWRRIASQTTNKTPCFLLCQFQDPPDKRVLVVPYGILRSIGMRTVGSTPLPSRKMLPSGSIKRPVGICIDMPSGSIELPARDFRFRSGGWIFTYHNHAWHLAKAVGFEFTGAGAGLVDHQEHFIERELLFIGRDFIRVGLRVRICRSYHCNIPAGPSGFPDR